MALQLRFSPTLDLGHVLGAALVTAVTVSGWFLVAHDQIHAEFGKQAGDIQLLSQRIDQDEKLMSQEREDQRSRDARVTTSLDKIDDEIRALIASKADGPRR